MFVGSFSKETFCKVELEKEKKTDSYTHNHSLNGRLILEVRKVVERIKPKKATGIDDLSNSVMKSPKLLRTLFGLFQACFENGIIPSVSYKSTIKPIPKSSKMTLKSH